MMRKTRALSAHSKKAETTMEQGKSVKNLASKESSFRDKKSGKS